MFESVSRAVGSLWWRLLRNGPPDDPADEPVDVLITAQEHERVVLHVLDLATRLGDAMLSAGASAHEVTVASTRAARAYGLTDAHVVVTYNSLSVSFQQGEDEWPATVMRVVKWDAPDHSKLQALQELLYRIEGGLDLNLARARLRRIRRTRFPYRPAAVVVASALLAMGVSVMFGASAAIMAATFAAALMAAVVQATLARTGLPLFFNQVAGGFVVTLVTVGITAAGDAGLEVFTDVRPSIIVASGIMMMLAGMSAVGATQDAIDGFAVTASGRILDLMMRTLGVVIGILVGLQVGVVMGTVVPLLPTALPFGSVPQQLVGAAVVSAAAALTNGGRLKTIFVSGILGGVTMIGFAVATALGLDMATASGVGALASSFAGGVAAKRLHIPAIAVTTAAIIPLVPGVAIFRGLLGIVQAEGAFDGLVIGGNALVLAAITAVALAAGVSFGLYMATPVRDTLRRVTRSRVGLHH